MAVCGVVDLHCIDVENAYSEVVRKCPSVHGSMVCAGIDISVLSNRYSSSRQATLVSPPYQEPCSRLYAAP